MDADETQIRRNDSSPLTAPLTQGERMKVRGCVLFCVCENPR